MIENSNETVYTTRNRNVFHTDRSCPNLLPAKRVHNRSRAHVANLPECKVCAGADIGGASADPMKRVRLLEELDPDKVG